MEIKKIDEYLSKLEENNDFSGVVGVYNKEDALYEKAFGYACYNLDIKNEVSTKFKIGSLTKQFTACCVLRLAEENRLELEHTVSKYIKDMPNGDSITIRHLLTQSSGIFDYTDADNFDREGKVRKSIEQVVDVIKSFKQTFKPGEKWEYSNSNYILLSYIVQLVSNMKFEDYVEQKLLIPNDIIDTHFSLEDKIICNQAYGYVKKDGNIVDPEFLDMSQPRGAGGLYSTLGDMKKWCNLLMNGKIISKASVDEMFKCHVKIAQGVWYGYGQVIRNGEPSNTHEAGHYGGMPGFMAYMSMYKDLDTSIILLSNFENDNLVEIVSLLKNSVFS